MKRKEKKMGEDKKKSIFYIKPPSSSTSSSSPPCWQTCAIFFCVCVIFPPLELRPPPVFRESAWSRDQKNSFLLSYFLYFFSSFPGLKPFCWAHTHTHTLLAEQSSTRVFPPTAALSTHWEKNFQSTANTWKRLQHSSFTLTGYYFRPLKFGWTSLVPLITAAATTTQTGESTFFYLFNVWENKDCFVLFKSVTWLAWQLL